MLDKKFGVNCRLPQGSLQHFLQSWVHSWPNIIKLFTGKQACVLTVAEKFAEAFIGDFPTISQVSR